MKRGHLLLVCLPTLIAVVVLIWPVSYPQEAALSAYARANILAAQIVTVAFCVFQPCLHRVALIGLVSASCAVLLFAVLLKYFDRSEHQRKWRELDSSLEQVDRQLDAAHRAQ